MTRKEITENVLARVPEEKKEAFVKEVVECKDKAEKAAVLEKYGVSLTAEEQEAFRTSKVSDEEIDDAAGGCACFNCHSCCPTPETYTY